MGRPVLLLCLILTATPAAALRCGTSVVSEGDSTLRLLERCGEPTQVERFEHQAPVKRYDPLHERYYTDYAAEPYEIWTYNFGPRRLITHIRVRHGKIERIDTGGYGY
jgi:hypothetical protein